MPSKADQEIISFGRQVIRETRSRSAAVETFPSDMEGSARTMSGRLRKDDVLEHAQGTVELQTARNTPLPETAPGLPVDLTIDYAWCVGHDDFLKNVPGENTSLTKTMVATGFEVDPELSTARVLGMAAWMEHARFTNKRLRGERDTMLTAKQQLEKENKTLREAY